MTISRQDIQDMVENGLVSDIFRMERAFELLKASGERANELNDYERGNFGELFGAFQTALSTESILAVARIYDEPNKKYPTRCIKGVLNFLVENSNELPTIREPYQLRLLLEYMNSPKALIETVASEPQQFASRFAAFIASLLGSPVRMVALEKLKTVRDKTLAHNEQTSRISGPTWESLQDLLEIVKNVVGALGWAYFSTAYVNNGEYILTEDAHRPANALNRLLGTLISQNLDKCNKFS